MSNFYHDPQERKANKDHRCTYCSETILKGDNYIHQTGVHEDRWFVSKMHPKCFDYFCELGKVSIPRMITNDHL